MNIDNIDRIIRARIGQTRVRELSVKEFVESLGDQPLGDQEAARQYLIAHVEHQQKREFQWIWASFLVAYLPSLSFIFMVTNCQGTDYLRGFCYNLVQAIFPAFMASCAYSHGRSVQREEDK